MSKLVVYCTVPHYGGIYSVYRRIRQALRGSDWQIKCVCLASELKDWYGYDPALADEDVVVLDDAGLEFSGSCRLFVEWLKRNDARVLIPASSKVAVSSVPWAPPQCHVVSRCVDITPYVLKLATANREHLSKIVYTSPRQGELLADRYGCSREVLAHIPNTLDPVEPVGYRPPSAGQPVRLVYFDRLDEFQKSVSMIPAIVKALMRRGHPVVIDIIGDGPDKEKLAAGLEAQGLESVAQFHGSLPHDAAFAVIRDCHFLIKPTRFEGFPSSLLEAAVQGAYPVCSIIPGVTDWILEEEAFLAKMDDVDAFCDRIEWAVKNPGAAAEKHRALVQQLQQRFSFENFRKNWLGLLQGLEAVEPAGKRLPDASAIGLHPVFRRSHLSRLIAKMIKPRTRRKLKAFFLGTA